MKQILSTWTAGILFGLGLCVSGMNNPAKVLGFLDVTGNWDPSLAFVMFGALLVSFITFRLLGRIRKPVCAEQFNLPGKTDVDRPLMIGAVIFGLGWGLAGFCPGPALVDLAFGIPDVTIFVVSMIGGMGLYQLRLHRVT